MLQPRQHDLFARLFDLAGQKHLVQDGIDLVEVEDQVQLAHVAEELIEHLDKEMDGLQIGQLVVVGVDADAEEQPGVPAVDDLGGREVLADQTGVGGGLGRRRAELDKVGLVLLVAGGDEAVDLRDLWSAASDLGVGG